MVDSIQRVSSVNNPPTPIQNLLPDEMKIKQLLAELASDPTNLNLINELISLAQNMEEIAKNVPAPANEPSQSAFESHFTDLVSQLEVMRETLLSSTPNNPNGLEHCLQAAFADANAIFRDIVNG